MSKIHVFIASLLIALVTLFFSIFSVFAEQHSWNCPSCGRRDNGGNYCGSCGHAAPWMEVVILYSSENNFEYKVENGQAIITRYVGQENEVIVPPTLGGYPVVAIGYCNSSLIPTSNKTMYISLIEDKGYAFAENEKIINVILPEGIERIDHFSFYGCTNLKKINLPASITYLGDCVFNYCMSLTEITLPESITSIPFCTFEGCFNLSNIFLPDSITSIGIRAFCDCSMKTIELPERISYIGATAFASCNKLATITLPPLVTKIDIWTFQNCYQLNSIILSDSIVSIDERAFEGCDQLTLYVPDNSFALEYCKVNEMNYQIR